MEKVQYIILGAGPSGLVFAHTLIDSGVSPKEIVVIEKEAEAGGLCRSKIIDGAPLDTGGGHFFEARYQDRADFIFRFLPRSEWNFFNRISTIQFRGQEVDHPLESNIWQLPKNDQGDLLESMAKAGCIRNAPLPDNFSDWVCWKLGERIGQEYLLPYNRKIWSMDLSLLGTDWLQKLPNVSFRECLQSCLEGKAQGAYFNHGTFYYPKQYGFGEVWRRMGVALNDRLVLNTPITSLNLSTRTVNNQWQGKHLINTIPWTLWPSITELPAPIAEAMRKLRFISLDIDYVSTSYPSKAHWVYVPDEKISYHRMLLRSNFSTGAKGYWTEANASRSLPNAEFRFYNEYAYPVSTRDRAALIQIIQTWAHEHGIIPVGRWGRWQHMNSDVALYEARQAAHTLREKS